MVALIRSFNNICSDVVCIKN